MFLKVCVSMQSKMLPSFLWLLQVVNMEH